MHKILLLLTLLNVKLAEAQLPSYVPTLDLNGFYTFSGNVLDNSGNEHNTTNYNVISSTDRYNNTMNALYFSGSSSEYLNYGDVDDFEPYQASISFWINPEEFGTSDPQEFKPIISKWSAPLELEGSTFNIFMDATNLCFVLTDGAISDTLTTSLSAIQLNEWSHVVITASYGFIKFYINNVLTTDTNSPISSFNTSASEFKVGGWYQDVNSSFSSFKGKIDDLGIWGRKLNACDIEQLYTGLNCETTGLDFLTQPSSELVKIIDLMGREREYTPNTPLIFVYSDGTRKKMMRIEL